MTRLNVGDKMPDFEFNTAYENGCHVHEILKGKTIFWVLRYIGCTICRYDVHMIAKRYDEFKQKGAQVYVVMQSDQTHVQNDLKEIKLPFDIICDPEMKIYHHLDIRPASSMESLLQDGKEKLMAKGAQAAEAGFSHGDYEGNEQQLPALFIVEEDGTTSYVHYASAIMDMPDIDEVLNILG